MRNTIHKWFWPWNFEKEEKWLNEMSSKGHQLVAVEFCKYIFEASIKDKYAYRLELLENMPSSRESISYIGFLEETGVEYIGSVARWAYFRKEVTNTPFEIYSDIDSKIKHYKRIMILFFAVSFFFSLNAYTQYKHSINLVYIIVSFLFTLLLGLGIVKVSKQISKLKKEKTIRE